MNRKEREREKSREKRCEKARERWVEVRGGRCSSPERGGARQRVILRDEMEKEREKGPTRGLPPFFF